ncbi:aromatic ring-hydroxylating dioxygenase subunit alpha [Pseudomonas gingeri]|uniref:Aromatic ring-hydroxylating dioxygenase subunit alpha n=1 Tax=Pseudomonas gingeri TaxID=117681 RepID=A0A7Y7XH66_9PSED|nr:aromatic ring-hydroxylating dioxygenase subunit alpha [Pseudomonas gingeri]NWB99809.1 aromatic ring-hydroxylating dioxygenase subunit alpha [Pseudomonas gingeri]
MSYLNNAWYVAAWASEVTGAGPLGRVILDRPIVLWRDSSGQANAQQDRCPHRFLPLSLGRVKEGTLVCGYHGLGFNGQGQCVHNPHGNQEPPKGARVQSYPLVERWSLLWIWMGDPALATQDSIPNFERFDPEGFYVGQGYLLLQANYQLETDNLMDLSHLDYVHPNSLSSGSDVEAETALVQEGRTVFSRRLTRGERLPPVLEQRHGYTPGTLVDRWLDMRWEAPCNLELLVGHALAGVPDLRATGAGMCFAHLLTPESEKSTHYWFAVSRPRSIGEQGRSMVDSEIEFLRRPFETEDLPVLEAQQKSLGSTPFWDAKPILLWTDAAAVRARRVLDALIAAESN